MIGWSVSVRQRLRASIFTGQLCALLICPMQVHAQVAGELAPPPVRQALDQNGVDVITGVLDLSSTDLTIGPSDIHGLTFQRYSFSQGFNNSQLATIQLVGGLYIVTLNGKSDSFAPSGGGFAGTEGNGATLQNLSGTYVYTARDGTTARFAGNAGYPYPFYEGELARLASITYPDGTMLTYTFTVQTLCTSEYAGNVCQTNPFNYVARLQSVTNNNGYQLKFSYASNSNRLIIDNYEAWGTLISVTAINNAVEYCDPQANTCTLTGNWPKVVYTQTTDGFGNQIFIATDPLGRATSYTDDGLQIKRPGATSYDVVATKDVPTQHVTSIVREGVTHTYSYADSGTTRTTIVTDPNGQHRTYVGDTVTRLISSFSDELGNITTYQHDSNGRLTEIRYPEGNKVQYTYDARGNITLTRAISKTPGTPADVVVTASYPASCSNIFTCNRPTATVDALGNQTDYTYDAGTGLITSITQPAPAAGAVRPQVRYSYAQQSGQWKLTGTSVCQTVASCSGTANEIKVTTTYDPSNLLLLSATKAAGDNSLVATTALTYDSIGNIYTVDGPLAGTADTTRYRYDAARELVGVVGPDPDGAGPLKNRATRLTYNLDGQVTAADRGTVASQSDADWSTMAVLQTQTATYDANARKVTGALVVSGTTFSLSQASYDVFGRTKCLAQRMNPAGFGSLPADACSLGTAGSFGPDRIRQNSYDAAGRAASQVDAYGTSSARATATLTYTPNGKLSTFADGNGNLATFAYDGFDRALATYYPTAGNGAVSNALDYHGLSYDADSRVTQRRMRDGAVVNYSYDALSRVTYEQRPNQGYDPNINYYYDNLGRTTLAIDSSGHRVALTYDALSRTTSQGSYYYTVGQQYDLAGHRTRLTWGDGNYVSYDYDLAGEMTAIHENGATSGVGLLATYAYDNLGRRTGIARGNGTATSYAYDPASRLTSLGQDLGGTAYDLTLGYGNYNPAGQVGSKTRSNDAYAWTQGYNVDRPYTSNGLNQLTAAGSVTPTYDVRGNLTSAGGASYGYNSNNHLWVANGSDGYYYDPAGRLEGINAEGVSLGYEGDQLIGEYNPGTYATVRRYVPGPDGDDTLIWYEGAGLTDKRYLHADEQGSVIAVTDGSGNSLAINAYNEYGIPGGTQYGRFGYTGQKWLPTLGMYDYKARMYSPTLGRFLQSDPAGYGGGANLYNYVSADPVNANDPSGMQPNPNVKREETSPTPPEPETVITGRLIKNIIDGSGAYALADVRASFGPAVYFNLGTIGDAGLGEFVFTPQSNRNRCNDPIVGQPRSGLDAVEDFLQIASDGSGMAAEGIALFGLANAVIGDEPGALASAGVALNADRAAIGLGLLKSGVQFARGNYSGGVRTAGRALSSNVAGKLVGQIGRLTGAGSNVAGEVYSGQVGSNAQGVVSNLVCGAK